MSIYTDVRRDARRAICEGIFGKLSDEAYEALLDLRESYKKTGADPSWEYIKEELEREETSS